MPFLRKLWSVAGSYPSFELDIIYILIEFRTYREPNTYWPSEIFSMLVVVYLLEGWRTQSESPFEIRWVFNLFFSVISIGQRLLKILLFFWKFHSRLYFLYCPAWIVPCAPYFDFKWLNTNIGKFPSFLREINVHQCALALIILISGLICYDLLFWKWGISKFLLMSKLTRMRGRNRFRLVPLFLCPLFVVCLFDFCFLSVIGWRPCGVARRGASKSPPQAFSDRLQYTTQK